MAEKRAKNQGKIHTLFLHTGDYENNSFVCLAAYNKKGFDSVKSALKNLAGKVIEHELVDFEEKLEGERKSCKHKLGHEDSFCSRCGAPRKKDPKELLNEETAKSWFYGFIHDAGGYLWNFLNDNGWLCGSPAISAKSLASGVAVIHRCAETLLWLAYKDDPELNDSDGAIEKIR